MMPITGAKLVFRPSTLKNTGANVPVKHKHTIPTVRFDIEILYSAVKNTDKNKNLIDTHTIRSCLLKTKFKDK